MINQARHICRCGQEAVAENGATGDWFCLGCALDEMLAEINRGELVTVSFGTMGISDVLVVPGDHGDGDLLAHLADAVAISFCRN